MARVGAGLAGRPRVSPDTSYGLVLQRMGTSDRLLSLSALAATRADLGEFQTAEIRGLLDAFRLPLPTNLSRDLGRLRSARPNLLRPGRNGRGGWMLTPEGQQRASELMGEIDLAGMGTELAAASGAFFAHGEYPTLPPTLAPPSWAPGIKTFLERHPFDRNVFLMTRFPDKAAIDPLSSVITAARDVVSAQGLTLHVASDQQIVDDLWGNVGAHMWSCRYGIGILETLSSSPEGATDGDGGDAHGSGPGELNDNVLIELGSMLTIGRRCMILRDTSAPMPPTDLTAQIFKPVGLDDLDEVAEAVAGWIRDDLRLS